MRKISTWFVMVSLLFVSCADEESEPGGDRAGAPATIAQASQVRCPERPCVPDELACDANGVVAYCVVDADGCPTTRYEQHHACAPDTMCYDGVCEAPQSFSFPAIPALAPGALDLSDAELYRHPMQGAVVVTRAAFERALYGRYWEAADQQAVDLGASIAGKANDSRVAGVLVTPTSAEVFSGDVFIVLNEPYRNGQAIQSESFDVYAIGGLSGFTDVVGSAEFVAFERGELGLEACCGVTSNICTPEGGDVIPPLPSGPPCSPHEWTPNCIHLDTEGVIEGLHLGGYRGVDDQDRTARFSSIMDPQGVAYNNRAITRYGILSTTGVDWSDTPVAIGHGVTCNKCAVIQCANELPVSADEPTEYACGIQEVPWMCMVAGVGAGGPIEDCFRQYGEGEYCLEVPTGSTISAGASDLSVWDDGGEGPCGEWEQPGICKAIKCQPGSECEEKCTHDENKEAAMELFRIASKCGGGGAVAPPSAGALVKCCGDGLYCSCAYGSGNPLEPNCVACTADDVCTEYSDGGGAAAGGGSTDCGGDTGTFPTPRGPCFPGNTGKDKTDESKGGAGDQPAGPPDTNTNGNQRHRTPGADPAQRTPTPPLFTPQGATRPLHTPPRPSSPPGGGRPFSNPNKPDVTMPTSSVPQGADPIVLATGALYMDVEDLSFPGPVEPLRFGRFYRSQSDERSILGSNWSHTYDVRIVPITPYEDGEGGEEISGAAARDYPFVREVAVAFPDGSRRHFYLDGSEKERSGAVLFKPQAGVFDTLYMNLEGWVLRTREGGVYTFGAFGGLESYRDRFGNGYTVALEPTPLFRAYERYCRPKDWSDLVQGQPLDARLCALLRDRFHKGHKVRLDARGWGRVFGTVSGGEVFPLRLPVEDFRDTIPLPAEAWGWSDTEWDFLGGQGGTTVLDKDLPPEGLLKRELERLRAFARSWFATGPLPEINTGQARQRPARVVDDLGRSLVFHYHDDPADVARFGLLEEVEGPAGARVAYDYARPAGYPARLNEMFLVRAERADRAPGDASLRASAPRAFAYTYQWPGAGQPSYDASFDAAKKAEVLQRASRLRGCSIEDAAGAKPSLCVARAPTGMECATPLPPNTDPLLVDQCGPLPAGPGTPPPSYGSVISCAPAAMLPDEAPGNPCFEAERYEHDYASAVADNIARVERGPIVESETRYAIDASDRDRFDRAVAQRYGGRAATAYTSEGERLGPRTASGAWSSDYPEFALDYLHPRPDEAGAQDATDLGFLPEALRTLYPLEAADPDRFLSVAEQRGFYDGTSCGSRDAPPDPSPVAPQCDAETFEFINRDDVKCNFSAGRADDAQPRYRYFENPIGQGVSHPRIVRSRLGCEQLWREHSRDPYHNGTVTDVEAGKWSLMEGERAAIESDLRRACQWVRAVDRDGDERFYGLNYRGQILVDAAVERDGGGLRVQETIYNADSLVKQRRNPTSNPGGWRHWHGWTSYRYAEIEPVAEEPEQFWAFWWTRRANLLEVREHPAEDAENASALALSWQGGDSLEGGRIESVATALTYEPLYNQVKSRTALVRVQGAQGDEVVSRRTYDFDYQELTLDAFWEQAEPLRAFGFPSYLGSDGRGSDRDDKAAIAELHFYGEDLNGDTYADGGAVIGSPAFDDDGDGAPDRPAARVRGAVVRVVDHDVSGAGGDRFVWLANNPGGRPWMVRGSDGTETRIGYYRAGERGATVPEAERYGAAVPGPSAETGRHLAGLAGQVWTRRYAHAGPADLPAPAPWCEELREPFRRALPRGCAGASDALSLLEQLGVPPGARESMLASEGGDWDAATLSYNEAGHLSALWASPSARRPGPHSVSRFVHDVDGRRLAETDGRGTVTEAWLTADGDPARTRVVDASGKLLAQEFAFYDDERRAVARCADVKPGGCAAALGLGAACAGAGGQAWACAAALASAPAPDFRAPRELVDPGYLLVTYRYTAEGALAGEVDEAGAESSYAYDERDLVVAERHAPGAQTPGAPAAHPRALERALAYDDRGRLVSAEAVDVGGQALARSWLYDGLGREVLATDPAGLSRATAWDARGAPSAARISAAPYGAGEPRAEHEWRAERDGRGRPVRESAPGGIETSYAYAPGRGRPWRVARTGGAEWWLGYDGAGRLAWSRDAAGDQRFEVERERSAWGVEVDLRAPGSWLATARGIARASSPSQPDYVSRIGHGGAIEEVELVWRDGIGRASRSLDAAGLEARSEYDLAGRPVRFERAYEAAAGSSLDASYALYDARGAVVEVSDPSALGNVSRWHYDGFGREVAASLPGLGAPTTRQAWDAHGRLEARFERRGAGFDRLDYVYSASGRLDRVDLTRAGRGTRALLAYEYDAIGRTAARTAHNLTQRDLGWTDTTVRRDFAYDAAGRLSAEHQLAGAAYDATSSSWSLEAGLWARTLVPPSGRARRRSYDAAGRLSGLAIAADDQAVGFDWLGARRAGRDHDFGLAAAADPLRERRGYDALGRLQRSEVRALDLAQGAPADVGWGQRYCLGGAWDAAACAGPLYEADIKWGADDRIAARRARTGAPRLGAQGTPEALSSRGFPFAGYGYGERGDLDGEWLAADLGASWAQIPALGASRAEVAAAAAQGGAASWTWEREAGVGGLTRIKADAGSAVRWAHAAGGVVGEDRLAGHRLASVDAGAGLEAIAYDAMGRVSGLGDLGLSWDALGRLAEVRDLATGVALEAYLYGADGRLAAVLGPGGARRTIAWDGDQMIAAREEGASEPVWEAAWGGELDELVALRAEGRWMGAIQDERRSVLGLWDPGRPGAQGAPAALRAEASYDALGRKEIGAAGCAEAGVSGPGCRGLSGALPFGFAGAWQSEVTGMALMRARWYAPGLGQFVSRDPLGYADSFDPYAYAAFDPIGRWDPWGLLAQQFGLGCSVFGCVGDRARRSIENLRDMGGEDGFHRARARELELIERINRKANETMDRVDGGLSRLHERYDAEQERLREVPIVGPVLDAGLEELQSDIPEDRHDIYILIPGAALDAVTGGRGSTLLRLFGKRGRRLVGAAGKKARGKKPRLKAKERRAKAKENRRKDYGGDDPGDDIPRNNRAQNRQTSAVSKELGLTPSQQKTLHRVLPEMKLTKYAEILQVGKDIKSGKIH